MSDLVKSFFLDSLNSTDSCRTMVSQQDRAFFPAFLCLPIHGFRGTHEYA